MCEPITIGAAVVSAETLMVGVSAASAVLGYMAQQDQADRIASSQKASYDAQMSQLQEQRQQINEQASDQMSARAMQAQRAQASLRVSAGESGVSGVSEDRNEGEVMFNESQDIATIDKNRRAQINQTTANAMGIQAQTQSALNQAPHPSLLGAGLQIAGTYAGIAAKKPTNTGAGKGVQTNQE